MSNDIVTDDVYDELKRDYNAKCAELAQAHERLDTLEGIEDRLRGELAGQAEVVEAARRWRDTPKNFPASVADDATDRILCDAVDAFNRLEASDE